MVEASSQHPGVIENLALRVAASLKDPFGMDKRVAFSCDCPRGCEPEPPTISPALLTLVRAIDRLVGKVKR